jgi:hypothetical protein
MRNIQKRFSVLISILLFSNFLFGQAPVIEWEKTIGGNGGQLIFSGHMAPDGGFVTGGYVSSGLTDFYLLKTDNNGDVVWEKTFGHEDRSENARGINSTSDGGTIMVGPCEGNPPYTYNSDTYLVKTDADGNLQWDSQIGDDSWSESCGSIMQTSDTGYIMCGSVWAYPESGWDVYVLKTFSDGSYEWQGLYDFDLSAERGLSVIQTADSGYAITGKTQAYSMNYGYNAFILKLDPSGNTQWLKTYGYSWPQDEDAMHIFQTSDNGFFICGSSSEDGMTNRDWYVVKTDVNGDSLWQRTIGDFYHDGALGACETDDGGFAVTGTMYNDGSWNAFMVKYDTDGNLLWTKQWGDTDYTQNEYWVHQTSDEGFIVAGQTNTESNDIDVHLTKFTAETIGINENHKHPLGQLPSITKISPNPCSNQFEINYSLAKEGTIKFDLLDIHGEIIMGLPNQSKQAGTHNEIVDTSSLSEGIYFCRLSMEGHSRIAKICVVH